MVKEWEKYKEQLAYAAGFINQNIGDIYKPFVSNAGRALEKWKALKKHFKDFNPVAVIDIIAILFTKHIQDFKNVKEFVSHITSNLDHLIKMNQPINYEVFA